jgi:hypothetical protein
LAACASLPRYDAAFSAVDQNHDALIEWWEFEAAYPNADPKTFLEADHNKDGQVTAEEWQYYADVNRTR